VYHSKKIIIALLAILVLSILLTGCSTLQSERQTSLQSNQADDVMEGKGLFSGEGGEVLLFRK
jgi:outer membrane PBP1 activator LpoA protein